MFSLWSSKGRKTSCLWISICLAKYRRNNVIVEMQISCVFLWDQSYTKIELYSFRARNPRRRKLRKHYIRSVVGWMSTYWWDVEHFQYFKLVKPIKRVVAEKDGWAITCLKSWMVFWPLLCNSMCHYCPQIGWMYELYLTHLGKLIHLCYYYTNFVFCSFFNNIVGQIICVIQLFYW